MSSPTAGTTEPIAETGSGARASGWALWKAQVIGILRMEIRKSLFGRRALPLVFLASLPVILFGVRAVLPLDDDVLGTVANSSIVFAAMYQTFLLRFAIFLGCVVVFTHLFRGEMLERSLHYYFLTPVRREVLVVGKYLAGQVAASVIFCIGVTAAFILLYLPHGSAASEFFLNGPGFGHLAAYLGVTILGVMGYGAVFMMVGLIFKNPIIPGFIIFCWEGLNVFMPALLKKISVIHYLQSLCPVPLPKGGPVKILVDPSSPWMSVPGLIILTILVLTLAAWRVRHMEISYGGD